MSYPSIVHQCINSEKHRSVLIMSGRQKSIVILIIYLNIEDISISPIALHHWFGLLVRLGGW